MSEPASESPATSDDSGFWASVQQDMRFARRTLRRHLMFSCVMIAVLSIGIGAAAAILTAVNVVLLRPLPVRAQSELVALWGERLDAIRTHIPLTMRVMSQFSQQSSTMQAIAGVDYNGAWPLLVRDGDRTTALAGVAVTGNFFSVLGTNPVVGRTLLPSDDRIGVPTRLVISYNAWQRHFGGDSSIVGRSIMLHERSTPATIIGVAPQEFQYPKGSDFWVAIVPWSTPPGGDSAIAWVDAIGRLKKGSKFSDARGELTGLLQRAARLSPEYARVSAVGGSFASQVNGEVRPALVAISAAVLLVLVLVCTNAAYLFTARGAARASELGIRAALGADPSRLVRQLVTESVWIIAVAAILGLVCAAVALRLLVVFAPPGVPRLDVVRFDGAAFLIVGAVTLFVGLTFGLVPAMLSVRRAVRGVVTIGSRSATAGPAAKVAQELFVVSQVGLAALVLSGTGLVIRSLLQMQAVDMGFATPGLLVVQLGYPYAKYSDRDRLRRTMDAVIERVKSLPGVLDASSALTSPFSGTAGYDATIVVDGQTTAEATANPLLSMEVAAPTYFHTLGVPITSGRGISGQDGDSAPRVIVLAETARRALFPTGDGLGRRVRLTSDKSIDPWLTVVGIAGDTRYRQFDAVRPSAYLPAAQAPWRASVLLIRTRSDTRAVQASIRQAIPAVDRDLQVMQSRTMDDILAAPLARPRFTTILMGAFAIVSVIIASLGIFGILTSAVRERTREIGIRMAFGATPTQAVGMILGRTAQLVCLGLVVGLITSVLAARGARALLFGVSPGDPTTAIGVAIVILGAASAAALVPAIRASHIDPGVALADE
jgi:putative ABC transport system permease protein